MGASNLDRRVEFGSAVIDQVMLGFREVQAVEGTIDLSHFILDGMSPEPLQTPRWGEYGSGKVRNGRQCLL